MTITKTASKSLVALAALVAIGAGAGAAGLASAQTNTATGATGTVQTQDSGKGAWHRGMMGGHMDGKGRGVAGTVSAVNGSTVTVTAKDGTSYTIDASTAKISKVVDISASDIKVGDTIGAMGSVSGTSVKAVHIMDGVPPTPQAPPKTAQ